MFSSVFSNKEGSAAPKPTTVIVPHTPTSGLPIGSRESKDIADAHPMLQECWPKIQHKFETQYPGLTLKIAYVWRSPSFQAELYQIGRRGIPGEKVVTNCDGTNKPSHHNHYPSWAIDVDIYKDGKVLWADNEYEKLTPIVQELGLVHGLTWVSFPDPQHIQLPSNTQQHV